MGAQHPGARDPALLDYPQDSSALALNSNLSGPIRFFWGPGGLAQSLAWHDLIPSAPTAGTPPTGGTNDEQVAGLRGRRGRPADQSRGDRRRLGAGHGRAGQLLRGRCLREEGEHLLQSWAQ